MIRLGSVAECTGHIGKYINSRPNISRLSHALHRRVEPADNFLGTLAKDDVFAGRAYL